MSSRWLKLTVAYDGGGYAGWQIQPEEPTVQGALQAAWREITQEDARLTAAGRTDAGVHALGQVVGLSTDSRLSNSELQRGLNAVLPEDVAVLAVEDAREGFHATHDAQGKRYRYRIHNGRTPDVFERRYSWHYPQPLDAERMHRAGQALVGRHDFASFESAGSERPDTVRTITELSVVREGGVIEGGDCWEGEAPAEPSTSLASRLSGSFALPNDDLITIDVSGDGFLYNMVRAIVGTLVEVGKGARDATWPAEVLAARDRRQAGQTVPPHGLFLVNVQY
jgi:tRNA pseudouridine38-40 synthase